MNKVLTLGDKTPRVRTCFNSEHGIYNYDAIDNCYPQRVENALSKSPTGSGCTDLYSTHLTGKGFNTPGMNTLVINSKGETLYSLLNKCNDDYAKYLACYFLVVFDGNLNPVELYHMPYKYVRHGAEREGDPVNGYKVYDDWDKNKRKYFRKADVKPYDLFNLDRSVIYKQIEAAGGFDKWNGQLYCHTVTGNIEYTAAACDPVFEDVETEHLIKVYYWRLLKKGFNPGGFMFQAGIEELPADATPEVRNRYIKEEQDAVKMINDNIGAEKSGNVILMRASSETVTSKFEQFKVENHDKLYDLVEERVQKRIIRNYGQPRVLHGVDQPGALGLSKEWEEGKKNYDERTAVERKNNALQFLSVLQLMFPSMSLTEAEMEVVPVTGIEVKIEKSLAEKLDVGVMQSMQQVVESEKMQSSQKINYLVIAFGVPQWKAKAMVEGGALPKEKEQAA